MTQISCPPLLISNGRLGFNFYVLKILPDFAYNSGGIIVEKVCLHANIFEYWLALFLGGVEKKAGA